MKTKRAVIISLVIVVFSVVSFMLYSGDLNSNGKLYSSKEKLCTHFAQSYLRTIQKTDNACSSEIVSSPENKRWEMAVDIETDFYNLCMLNLDETLLKTYKSTIIEKYQK